MRQGYTYIDVKPTIGATEQWQPGLHFAGDVIFD